MGYYTPDVYNQPEKFGLTLVKDLDTDDDYGFNIMALFRDESGNHYMGHDSGCSCPQPFEDQNSIEDLTAVHTLADIQRYLEQNEYWGNEIACADFLSGVRL